MTKQTINLGNDILCIDVDYMRPQLACSYLIHHQGKAAFIDCGTNHSVDRLLAALQQFNLKPEDVAFIIPSHVHLDHAGGAGRLMQLCPNAQLVVHPLGAPHLINPKRLVESARSVYGKALFAKLYGEIVPIDKTRVIHITPDSTINLNGRWLRIIDSPGHARHHICVYDALSRAWFVGDTFGLSYPDITLSAKQAWAKQYLMPTTTPVQFDPSAWQQTLQKLLSTAPEKVFLAHFADFKEVEKGVLKLQADIQAYVHIAEACSSAQNRVASIEESLITYTLNDLKQCGCEQDKETILAILKHDLHLNAQGLDIWLARQETTQLLHAQAQR